MKNSIKVLPVEQPIGTFYLGVIPAKDLLQITSSNQRKDSDKGIQRVENRDRINEITTFTFDPDATFPTPIIISVYEKSEAYIADDTFVYDDEIVIGEILDGQHRLKGLEYSSEIDKFQMPVVLMFGMTDEENAYVFSIINSKQTKVNTSLIYDLYGLSTHRSPQKTAHDLARSLHSMQTSPFYRRLKMLGVKVHGEEEATLSQGTFAKAVMTLYSKNIEDDKRRLRIGEKLEDDESLFLRQFFIEEKDEIILLILLNCFNALQRVFIEEWENPQTNILWKSTGFSAVIKALPFLIKKGTEEKELTEVFFEGCFKKFKTYLENNKKELTSRNYGSGEQAQKSLADEICHSIGESVVLKGDHIS